MSPARPPGALRRSVVALLAGAALTACQHAPQSLPPVQEPVPTLQRLGFVAAPDGWQLDLGVKLLFDTDSARLSDAGRDAVVRLAQELRQAGIKRMRIDGHTDDQGSARHNAALSRRRADTVARLITDVGWNDLAVERLGFGADRPVAENTTAEGRAQNRRVVLTVTVD